MVCWRLGLTGGQGAITDYEQCTINGSVLAQGEKYVGNATSFFRDELKWDYGDLVPKDNLITSGSSVILAANIGNEYVAYDEDGGTIGVNLSGASGSLNVRWYDPRNGTFTGSSTTTGGGSRTFTSPSSGTNKDWVLHIYKQGTSDTTPPAVPTGLSAIAVP